MGCQLGYEYRRLLLRTALLEEDLVSLSKDKADEELDHVPAGVGGRSVEEVLIDVGEHSRTRPEVVVGLFEAFGSDLFLLEAMEEWVAAMRKITEAFS